MGGSLSPGSILPLRGTGDAASGLLAEKRHHRRCREPGNFAARVLVGRRPGSWIAEWMDRRVVRELSLLLVTLPPPNFAPPSSPFNSILERVVRCWHSNAYSSLFSSLFFFDPPSRFVQIPREPFTVSILLALLFSLFLSFPMLADSPSRRGRQRR